MVGIARGAQCMVCRTARRDIDTVRGVMSCRVGVLTCRDLAMGIVAAPLRVASPVHVFHVAVTLAADQSGTVHRYSSASSASAALVVDFVLVSFVRSAIRTVAPVRLYIVYVFYTRLVFDFVILSATHHS